MLYIKEKLENFLKKNFPNRVLVKDKKIVSEIDYEVYGFMGVQILICERGNKVHYYPLMA